MKTDNKTEKIEKTEEAYNKLLKRISELCNEAEQELNEAA